MKFTIITVVFNGEKYLLETIESVKKQTYQNIEYIIIDGGSTDSTVDIIKRHESFFSHWQSEPDKNMYDAINKGLSFATGDYILCLNSDDQLLTPNTIAEVAKHIQRNPNFLAYYGNIIKLKGGIQKRKKSFQCSYQNLLYSQHCSFIPHPSLFVSRIVAQNYHYSTLFSYASDYDYILGLAKIIFLKYIPVYVTLFRDHPESITSSGKLLSERIEILKKNSLFSKNYLLRQFHFIRIWFFYKLIQVVNA